MRPAAQATVDITPDRTSRVICFFGFRRPPHGAGPCDQERIRLKRIVSSLREREGGTGGFIARTACIGHTEQELQDDMRYLLRTWGDVRRQSP